MTVDASLVVEPYSPHVSQALLALNEAAFPTAWGERWSDKDLLGALALPGVSALLAGDGSHALFGFLLARTAADEAEVLLVGVLPDKRGFGVGGQLIKHFLQISSENSLQKVFLEVRETNFAARALYDKIGFAEIGRRESYYQGASGERAAAITLAKYLSLEDVH